MFFGVCAFVFHSFIVCQCSQCGNKEILFVVEKVQEFSFVHWFFFFAASFTFWCTVIIFGEDIFTCFYIICLCVCVWKVQQKKTDRKNSKRTRRKIITFLWQFQLNILFSFDIRFRHFSPRFDCHSLDFEHFHMIFLVSYAKKRPFICFYYISRPHQSTIFISFLLFFSFFFVSLFVRRKTYVNETINLFTQCCKLIFVLCRCN